MKILHVIANLAPRYGGPSNACVEMARAVARLGHDVSVYTTDMDGPSRLDVPTDRPIMNDGVAIHYFPVHFPRIWGASRLLAHALHRAVAGADIVHVHSLYMFHDWVVGRDCRSLGIPYLLRPHGTLDPFIHRRHRMRKMLFEVWFQNSMLSRAAALHYTSEEEMWLAEPFARGAPGVVIPNGVDCSEYDDLPPPGSFRARHPEIGDKKIVLFFGRLNFKKGLDILAKAYGTLARARDDVHLVLAGPDDGMASKTRRWLRDEGVLDRATFTGMLLGEEKLAALRDSDVFVLPSYSENFGIAVVEAMACALPVVVSDRVNIWREVDAARAGRITPCDADAVAEALAAVLGNTDAPRKMGARGASLVREKFDWSKVALRLEGVYTSLAARA